MKTLLLIPILLLSLSPNQEVSKSNDSPVTVVSSKWFKDQRVTYDVGRASLPSAPEPEAPRANSEPERRKISDSVAVHTPSSDPIDKRSAELERMAVKPAPKYDSIPGYTYQAKVLNKSAKTVRPCFGSFNSLRTQNPRTLPGGNLFAARV